VDDGVAAQQALRARWRFSVDLGVQVTASENVPMADGIVAANNPQGRLAAGLSLWRAVHPAVDLGVGVGAMGPHDARSVINQWRCAAGEEPVEAPFGAGPPSALRYRSVQGVSPYAVAGLRIRPWGARLPVHLVAQAGVSLRLLSGRVETTEYCGVRDEVSREVISRREVALSADGAQVPGFVWNIGVQTHFGAREQWSFGSLVWVHHDAPTYVQPDGSERRSVHVSAVFQVGFTPSFGPALPEAAQARGRRARNVTLASVGTVVGTAVLVGVVGLLLNPP